MQEFLTFLFILVSGLFFSSVFNRLHLPWVAALIIAGVITGPPGLNLFEITPTLAFLGEVGLVFLMFTAGLETRLSRLREVEKEVALISALNVAIPFLVAFLIGASFGYDLVASFLLGVVFISSSIAVIVPSLERSHLFQTRLGSITLGRAIIEDILALLLLSLLLQVWNPVTAIPLYLFFPLLFVVLIAFRWAIPFVFQIFLNETNPETDIFEQRPRVVFVIVLATVVVFQLLGFHPIIAGFFAGLVLSEQIVSKELRQKLHVLAYGVFIPVFFVLVGAQTDISLLANTNGALSVALLVFLGAVLSKIASGWLGGRLSGLSQRESLFIGVATIPRLSITLAVLVAGGELGIVDDTLAVALLILIVGTTLITPALVRVFGVIQKGETKKDVVAPKEVVDKL